MNQTEAAIMLTYIARVDRRTLGDDDAAAFADLLDDIAFTDAMQAAREHLRSETVWLTPAHIRARVKAAHSGRPDDKLAEDALPEPDADPDDTAAYIAALREGRRRWATTDAKARPVAELMAGAFGRMPDATHGSQQKRRSISHELFAGFANQTARIRALVLAQPDLAEALTQPPIGYPLAEQWNGFIPPQLDSSGQLNTTPRRAALVLIAAEAERRATHQGA